MVFLRVCVRMRERSGLSRSEMGQRLDGWIA